MKTSSLHIKICGIKEADLAFKTAQGGADFIGIMFYQPSKRYVTLEVAKAVSAATTKAGAQAVAVFVDHTGDEMLSMCQACQINIAQLHGTVARQQHHFLPDHIRRIYVLHVNNDGHIINEDKSAFSLLNPERDYLLFDGLTGGSGATIKTDHLQKAADGYRFFLAGGLTPENVQAAQQKVKPFGVDVSSGVESASGIKDPDLIRHFISAVKGDIHNESPH